MLLLQEGTTHIIYATGSGPLKRLTNIRLTDHPHGLTRTRFLKIMTPDPVLPVDTKGLRIINNGTKIPSIETTYWCSTHSLPKEFESKHHVIQYEAVIQKGNEPLVHHMELFHCEVPPATIVPDYAGPCDKESKPSVLDACKRVIAAWAMGATVSHFSSCTHTPADRSGDPACVQWAWETEIDVVSLTAVIPRLERHFNDAATFCSPRTHTCWGYSRWFIRMQQDCRSEGRSTPDT